MQTLPTYAYLDVFAVLVRHHNLRDEMFRMRRNRLLADSLHELAELHR